MKWRVYVSGGTDGTESTHTPGNLHTHTHARTLRMPEETERVEMSTDDGGSRPFCV